MATRILVVVFALAIAAYGFDCPATSTPDEAMQCCDTMPCASHAHNSSQNCCQTMQATHAPFVTQSSSQGPHFSPVLCGFLPAATSSQTLDSATEMLDGTRSHAPPVSPPVLLSPLRI